MGPTKFTVDSATKVFLAHNLGREVNIFEVFTMLYKLFPEPGVSMTLVSNA